MDNKIKFHITGMGGQGSGFLSRIITYAGHLAGLSITSMETHGLAQRGGVVVSDISIGYDPDETPLCGIGEADVVISLEALEGVRALPKLKPEGLLVLNTAVYQPLATRVDPENNPYPSMEEIEKEIRRRTSRLLVVAASKDAQDLGLSQSMNVILLGALASNSKILPFSKEHLIEAIKAKVPAKYHETNLKAFEIGYNYSL